MAVGFASRAASIGTRIAQAEKQGAADCTPRQLAAAKSELVRVRQEATSARTSLNETEAAFLRAESLADGLVVNRQLAASRESGACRSEPPPTPVTAGRQ